MKIHDRMRYPHPVLWEPTGDFVADDVFFDLTTGVRLEELTDEPKLGFELALVHPELQKLLDAKKLRVGVVVRCRATYFEELRECGVGEIELKFPRMSLSGNVSIRPVAWLAKAESGLAFSGVVSEFEGLKFSLGEAALLAIGEEQTIHVGREKSIPLKSVFNLQLDPELGDEEFVVDTDEDQIVILAGGKAFESINELRAGDKEARAKVLNAVYLPVLQQVLQLMGEKDVGHLEGRRWFSVIKAKLESLNVELAAIEPLRHAQLLLKYPLRWLVAREAP